jgi:hypothetical protein
LASSLARDNGAIRFDMRKPWYAPLFALPFLAVGLYFLYYVALGLKALVTERGHGPEEYFALLLFAFFGLIFCSPGLVIVSRRYTIADKGLGRIARIFQIGPFKWTRDRKLDEFNLIRINWTPDSDNRGGSYSVELFGARGSRPLSIDAFRTLPPALALARNLSGALDLPFEDDSDAEPDDPDLESADASTSPKTSPPRARGAPKQARTHRKKSQRLSKISIANGQVSVQVMAPPIAFYVVAATVAANSLIWWFNAQVIAGYWRYNAKIAHENGFGALVQTLTHPHFSSAAFWLLMLVLLTLALGLPLIALLGMQDMLVFDKARQEVALVRKSALVDWRWPRALSPQANLTIGPRPGRSPTNPILVSFVAEPGARRRWMETFETPELAREYADKIARAVGLQVVAQN